MGKTSQRLSERMKQHVPKHLVDPDPPTKRRGRPQKRCDHPGEGYQSAIVYHLAVDRSCAVSYLDSDFRVLSRGRSKEHLNVLEAMYIYVLAPLCYVNKSYLSQTSPCFSTHTRHMHHTCGSHTHGMHSLRLALIDRSPSHHTLIYNLSVLVLVSYFLVCL